MAGSQDELKQIINRISNDLKGDLSDFGKITNLMAEATKLKDSGVEISPSMMIQLLEIQLVVADKLEKYNNANLLKIGRALRGQSDFRISDEFLKDQSQLLVAVNEANATITDLKEKLSKS